MHYRFVGGALVLAALMPALAAAQQQGAPAGPPGEGSWELSVGVGGNLLDQQISSGCCVPALSSLSRVAPGGVVRLGYNFTDMWNLSIGTGVGYSSPATFIQPFAAVTWTPNLTASTSPFLTLGGGATSVFWSTSGSSGGPWHFRARYGVHLGVGIRRMLSERMALRLEVREQVEHYVVPPHPVFTGTGTVGFSWFLGGRHAVASVAVNPRMATLASPGMAQQLSASPADRHGRRLAGRAVTWTSSDESVAAVSPTGMVTAVGNGHATITAVSEGVTGTASVTVTQTLAWIAVAPASATFDALGATQQLTASARDANNHAFPGVPFTWTSSDAAVATVSPSGLVTSVGNGTARITAASSERSASTTVTVAQTTASVTVTPAASTISRIGGTAQLTAQATDATGRPIAGKTFTWTSDAAGVATVSSAGVATSVANGVAHITARADGKAASATVTVTVMPIELPAVRAALVLRGVTFPPNSARLLPAARAALRRLATALLSLPDARWQLAGYTSSLGSALGNRRLSQQRAEVVKVYLESLGVPAASLTAVGYGSQHPIASNRTRAGRLQNMRVEIRRLQ
jgi:outer membrane protein OmpA-like peptidoglycan-associated protein